MLLPEDNYDFRSGSSLAAAHVSGVVALLLSIDPGVRFVTVESWLRQSQQQGMTGHSPVDACRTLQQADPSLDCGS